MPTAAGFHIVAHLPDGADEDAVVGTHAAGRRGRWAGVRRLPGPRGDERVATLGVLAAHAAQVPVVARHGRPPAGPRRPARRSTAAAPPSRAATPARVTCSPFRATQPVPKRGLAGSRSVRGRSGIRRSPTSIQSAPSHPAIRWNRRVLEPNRAVHTDPAVAPQSACWGQRRRAFSGCG